MKKLVLGIFCVFFPVSVCLAANVDTAGIGSKATALGGAYSAYADDPYAVYYNPAGLVQIKDPIVSGGVFMLMPKLNYYDLTLRQNGTTVLGPTDYSEDFGPLYIPHFGAAYPISNSLVFGVAAYVPYGLDLKWNDNAVKNPGAYSAFHTLYAREVVTPSMAYKVSDKLSVGAGISLGRSQMVAEKVFFPTTTQIRLDMADDFNYSLNAGVLYHPEDFLFLGLTYRGRAKAIFDGEVDVNGVDSGINVRTQFDHPEQIQGGIRYITPHHVTLDFDLEWTRWSIQKDQVGTFSEPLMGIIPEARYERSWDDTVSVRMGAEWKVNDTLDLRAGYFYDPSPVSDSTFDFGWPDADRKTYSLGAGLHKGNWTVDTVVQYFTAEAKRTLGGESYNLNHSYNDFDPSTDERVSLEADGHMWTTGVTLSYSFSK